MAMASLPLDVDRLWAFAAVARERGFCRAARALGRTQSSLSQAVAELERELGQPLFVRRPRGVELTAAGRLLQEHAARVLDELDRARARLAAVAEMRAGELTIGTSDTLACHLLPPVFAAFRARHPQVELRLVNRPSPAVAELVAARAVDVGVVTLPLPPGSKADGRPIEERVVATRVGAQRDVVIGPPGDATVRTGRRVSLEALAARPLVLLARGTGSRAHLDAAFSARGLDPRVAIETGSVDVCKRLAELGFGLSVVPAFAVERERDDGTLAVAAIDRAIGTRQVALLTPRPGPPTRVAEAFAAIAREALR
jgi:DNA-binding transcriptional LysR family regulator